MSACRQVAVRVALGVASLVALEAVSHELESSGPAKWDPKRLSYMPIDHAVKPPPGVFLPQFVVGLQNRWAVGQDIHVCFVGGSDELRSQILEIADQWFQHANLKIVKGSASGQSCSTNDHSEIRVGFAEPGYWSYIGTDALNQVLISNNLVSLNLAEFDKSPPSEPRFSGVVLHEFGHALGLEHEHQSPASGCDGEYDWDKLYSYYLTTYGWDKQKVDDNVRQLSADRSAYAWSQFDPDSIMIYGTDPKFLKRGTQSPCYLHDNDKLSALDFTGIETTYPKGDIKQFLGSRISALKVATAKLRSGKLRDLLSKQLDLHESQLRKLQ